ncbi:RNA polymerase recycling motor HelD [Listeria sp. PSOL-1]|uniref:RNA polymerase recycling motor HelD n=1 Tax=Listeria sp. PSOL-1 TaxID=1844999 RepID=UPI0013D05AA4|nr:RNA polymerase recycling motor HelD [Listeria sp. PSOL-1]
MKDSEWQKEQARVDYTIQQINKRENELIHLIEKVRQEASHIRTNFWEDVRVNLNELDDVSETNASIRQQEHFLRERERNYQHSEKQIRAFKKMKSSPYFARIDVAEKDEKTESLYIGISSFLDEEDHFLVYDWRAPIASIYYDGGMGEAVYNTPEGKLKVDVKLKRQYTIKKAVIQRMFDTTEAIGDEMLQEVLGEGSSAQMKSIVSTIQREQNQIIRDTTSDLLFVQGAAGSGKTSAILQRIAYLLYRFREGLDETQMMIFSPNRLFNHYIANVLPELGEKNMVQTTFHDFASVRLKRMEMKSLFEQFEAREKKQYKNILALKESLVFYQLVKRYAAELGDLIQFKNIKFRGKIIISKQEIQAIYASFPAYFKRIEKLQETSKKLRERLYVIMNQEAKKDWIKDEIELLSEENYHALVPTHLEFSSFEEEEDYLAKKLVRLKFKNTHEQIKQHDYFHLKQQYVQFIKKVPQLLDLKDFNIRLEEWEAERKQLMVRLNANQIALEDVVFFLELEDQLTGKETMRAMKFVFIDEIQDYTPAQIAYLRSIFPSSHFTLLGDLNQAIFKTKQTERSLIDEILHLFDPSRARQIELKKSYRSTYEITQFTRDIIQDENQIIPFERHGELPQIVEAKSYLEMMDKIVKQAKAMQEKYGMVAIIGKNKESCEHCYLSLYQQMEVRLIHLDNQKLIDGIMIIPSYLAKGLEFDGVIVLDASDENYHLEEERTLLYTICSRAMHQLFIISEGKPSRLLPIQE